MPLLAAAAAGIAFVVHLGREELVHRETHLFEQIAGIVACRAAFLGGHTEIINGNKHLDIAHELDNGENPERDKDDFAVPSVGKGAAVPLADAVGDVAATAAAFAFTSAVTSIDDAGGQDDGLGDLNAAARHIAGGHLLLVVLVGYELAAEYLDVAFAAIQNDLFLEYGYAAYRRAGNAVTGIDLELDFEEKGQVTGIIPAVEGQCFNVDIRGDDFSIFGADTDCVIDDHLIPFGKVYLQVFQTVFVGGRSALSGFLADGAKFEKQSKLMRPPSFFFPITPAYESRFEQAVTVARTDPSV